MRMKCTSCGVEDGMLITRKLSDPDKWALIDADEDLSAEFPDTWGAAHRARVTIRCHRAGQPRNPPRCVSCTVVPFLTPAMRRPYTDPNSTRAKCQHYRDKYKVPCVLYALDGSEFCRYHQNQTEAAS